MKYDQDWIRHGTLYQKSCSSILTYEISTEKLVPDASTSLSPGSTLCLVWKLMQVRLNLNGKIKIALLEFFLPSRYCYESFGSFKKTSSGTRFLHHRYTYSGNHENIPSRETNLCRIFVAMPHRTQIVKLLQTNDLYLFGKKLVELFKAMLTTGFCWEEK